MKTKDMKDLYLFPNGKERTYHRYLNYSQHAGVPYLQIHDDLGNIIRIFFGQ